MCRKLLSSRSFILLMLAPLVFVLNLLFINAAPPPQIGPVQQNIQKVADIRLKAEVDKLLDQSIKVSNSKFQPVALGYIDYDYTVNPYFTNIALSTLLRIPKEALTKKQDESRLEVTGQWLRWYLAKLALLPKTNIYSVFDYKIVKSNSTFTEYRMDVYNQKFNQNLPLYDSVDSYLASFISFSLAFNQAYPNEFNKLSSDDLYKYRLIESSLYGLVFATYKFSEVIPGNETYYLMDNLEVSKGLSDYCNLFGRHPKFKSQIKVDWACSFSRYMHQQVERMFEKRISSTQSEYLVALQNKNLSTKLEGSKDSIYPYYMAQFFPFILGMNNSGIGMHNRVHRNALVNLRKSNLLANWYSLNHNSQKSNFDPYPHFWLFEAMNDSRYDYKKFYDFYIAKHQRKYYYNINEAQYLIRLLYKEAYKADLAK